VSWKDLVKGAATVKRCR